LGVLLYQFGTPSDIVRVLLATLVPIYLLWKLSSDALFIDISGKSWLTASALLAVFSILLGCAYLIEHYPAIPHSHDQRVLSGIFAGLAIAKLAALSAIVSALLRRGLVDWVLVNRIALPWCLSAALISATAVVLVPSNVIAPFGVVSIVILLMPGVRIALAPLTLEWDRHR